MRVGTYLRESRSPIDTDCFVRGVEKREGLTNNCCRGRDGGRREIMGNGAWRNLPALRHLHDHRRRLGCFEWVVFTDDDTCVT